MDGRDLPTSRVRREQPSICSSRRRQHLTASANYTRWIRRSLPIPSSYRERRRMIHRWIPLLGKRVTRTLSMKRTSRIWWNIKNNRLLMLLMEKRALWVGNSRSFYRYQAHRELSSKTEKLIMTKCWDSRISSSRRGCTKVPNFSSNKKAKFNRMEIKALQNTKTLCRTRRFSKKAMILWIEPSRNRDITLIRVRMRIWASKWLREPPFTTVRWAKHRNAKAVWSAARNTSCKYMTSQKYRQASATSWDTRNSRQKHLRCR